MSILPLSTDQPSSTVSRVVELPEAPAAAEQAREPLTTVSLSGVLPFPSVPTPPGLADRP